MSFLIAIIQRYAHVILFLIFELIAFILIINFNQKQRDIFIHSSSLFSGTLLKKSAQLGDYLSLQQSNDDLLKENARLLDEIISMPRPAVESPDSADLAYEVIPAYVISNNITSMRNRVTIDKGLKDSIGAAMGVVTTDGVVGIVKAVNTRYAIIISLLNLDTKVSASIDGADFFGTITWDGLSFQYLKLTGIPTHASIKLGDKIITNGFSTIFPRGIEIGEIRAFDISKNGAFYDISVQPVVDFSSLSHVYILKSTFAEEITALEKDE